MPSDSKTTFWDKLIGTPTDFTMRNRAFNYVCLITFVIMVFSLVFDICICQSIMSFVITGLILILGVMYYFSRYKKKFQLSTFIYVFCCYATLSLNFFVNEGVNGPTLALFAIALVFVSILVAPRFHFFIIAVHVCVITTLLALEYYRPVLVPATYPTRLSRFLDWGSTCAITVTFLYGTINFLRKHYDAKRLLAHARAQEIEVQNEQITEQNKRLEQIDSEKNKLLSIVSHDLKAPLDSLHEYLYLLSEDLLPLAEKREIEERLAEQTRYTSDLLQNLMVWARAQMHGMYPSIESVNASVLVAQVVTNKKLPAAKKNIQLSLSIDPSLQMLCDPDMTSIIIRNLVNNALKFTGEGGSVTITAHLADQNIVVTVSDTGMGMSAERQAELFSLQTKATFGTHNERGIGLGLLMCKEFAEYQGGNVWFESTEGVGSKFSISLPATTAGDAKKDERITSKPSPKPHR